MKQKANQKTWILIAVLLAVLSGYVAVFFIPENRHITKLHHDLLDKQDFVTKSAETVEQLRQIEEQLNNTSAYNRTWTKHAPRSGEISILLGKIHALARSANVEIDRFDPEPAEKLDRLRRLPIEMVYSGKLPSVFQFLSDLEEMPQTIWINKVTIERAAINGRNTGDNISKTRGLTKCEVDLAIFMDNPENFN